MKKVIIIILFLFPMLVTAQTFTDVASLQGIDVIQQSDSHWGIGMAFYDFDNDGWDDLTFPTQFDSISFYRNVNGSFVNTGSYLYAPGSVRQILWVDLSNDGILDLCVSYADIGVRLYENDGSFNFTDITIGSGISTVISDSYGISCADPDLDGDLDLYVCMYSDTESNKFYENQGNSTFIESASSYGINDDANFSFMGSWFDYNNDNLIDLHVINDLNVTADALFMNNGDNTYTDVAIPEGVFNNGHNPMTTSISDFNNDGFQDVFVTDFANGFEIYGLPIDYKLFMNQAGGNFINVAPQMGVNGSTMGWGALWVDYDNDCFEDLYVATSFINTNGNPEETSFLYRNNEGNGFTEINDSIFGDIINSSYCPVKGDINNDGFYDIVVLTDSIDPNVLLNSGNNGNGYIKITPVGIVSNKQAIGAKVKVYAAGQSQYQTVFCGTALCAQYSQHMIFGVKNASIVDSVEVIFPSGIVVKEHNLPINQDYTIFEQIFDQVELASGADTIYLCQGDSIILGSQGYYNYSWNNGSTDSLILVSSPGVFQFQATTLFLDSIISSNELTVLWENFPSVQQVVMNPSCGMENLGYVNILLSNSNDSISTILWNNGSQNFSIDSLAEGVYSYEITTPNNCVVIGSVTLTESPSFDIQFTTTPLTDSQGGSVQFIEFGGVPDFSYTMNGQEQSSFIDSLDAGTYEVIVEDANGCIVTVEFVIYDESTTGLSDESTTSNKVFYKDESIVLCIEEPIEMVKVNDMNGKEIALKSEWIEESPDCFVNFVNLSQGLYQVYIKTNSREFTEMIFVP